MEKEETTIEETTAMVEAFSQLSMTADPFSKLPEQVIHRIFSFVPRTKEVCRASAVSKQWLRAWRSYPVSYFNIAEFMTLPLPKAEDEIEARYGKFIKFVDNSLSRIRRQSTAGMQKFELSTVDTMAPHVSSRWIPMALDNGVQELILRMLPRSDASVVPCLIPVRVFSADSITKLIFLGPIDLPSLDEISSVNLPCLRNLSLTNTAINDNQLRKILRGCPLLEMLGLSDCGYLSEIVISGFSNLICVMVTVTSPAAKLTLIRIKAPNLEGFCYKCGILPQNVTVKLNSPNLKYLEFDDRNKTDKWFHEFLAKFPLLQNLTIVNCNALKRIRIPNPLLHMMSIINCSNLTDVSFEAKTLKLFDLIGFKKSLAELTIRLDNPPVLSIARIIAFFVYWDQILDFNIFFKLQEFLMRSMTFGTFGFYVQAGPAQNENVRISRAHKQFPTSAYKMEYLGIGVNAPEESHSIIMDGVLSACHPTVVTLRISEGSNLDFVKFFCEEISKKTPHNRKSCCKRDATKCWRHHLKGVKIEGVSGVEYDGDLDFPSLINLLPALDEDNEISLRLKW